ncbi:MAG: DDE-type integrase/transposase/recombinase [Lachnospiraceae bacterium]|jgi:transposase InsO family protein|nr:DDE-type integrase/transposase/recombinase [Lachnospiraceae bacterium]MCH4034264.1 DDE-type integrase/transposase/recombinase [Lachnospiraceae bacterium]MCH4034945.1 DDE-type integrase/transposase/recombinase [Lachnospiraceae bacterium]MCH4035176.1 DDE-type integrase/transposase/recombinase [Lachnospiraceae bacterium]MDD6448496.1 DDE-type integrase/transposase/recombinase [Lachnospiraceae bacterium]
MNNIYANDELAKATAVAQFRFALIAPVIQGLYSDASATEYYKRITEKPLKLPDGTAVTYSYKTVEKWASMYKRGGYDALMPQARSDKGSARALSDAAIEEIYKVKEKFPRLNATQIYHHLVGNGLLSSKVNVCSVQRFIRRNDLKSARNPNVRDRKQFEEDAFGRMWQADTCYLPHITEDGQVRRVYAIMIIDDHSRLLVGGELFYSDNAANFQKVFKDAIAAYGIPSKLYVDNGCSYANEQLSLICGSLGVVLLHTRVRDGASKAKIERSWLTLKETWLYKLDMESIHSLAQFNGMLREYMRSYNTSFHSGIGCTPMDRYLKTKDQIKAPASQEWLDECFLNRINRRVKKDATVSIDKVSYDVPMQFIGQSVEIRFQPSDMSTAFILYDKKRFPIRQTNRVENCHTKRDNITIDYAKIGDAS